MSDGRTMWLAQDALRHRRSLMIELKADHGPVAIACDTVLVAHAKLQNDGGAIRDGFATIADEAGCSKEQARAFIEDAAAIGWLDDLDVDEDGRRFTVRVSGWRADQNKARAAWRKQAQRDRDRPDDAPKPGVTDRDTPRSVTNGHPTAQHSTVRTTTTTSLVGASPDEDRDTITADPEVLRLSGLLAELIRSRDPKAKVAPESRRWLTTMRLLIADRDGDTTEVERVLRWSQTDAFWQTNILSPTSLRRQFGQLVQKAQGAGATAHLRPVSDPCPTPPSLDAVEAWRQLRERIRERIPEQMFALWIAPLHAHRLEQVPEPHLVLGAPPHAVGWIRERFASQMTDAAGGMRVTVVPCSNHTQAQAA